MLETVVRSELQKLKSTLNKFDASSSGIAYFRIIWNGTLYQKFLDSDFYDQTEFNSTLNMLDEQMITLFLNEILNFGGANEGIFSDLFHRKNLPEDIDLNTRYFEIFSKKVIAHSADVKKYMENSKQYLPEWSLISQRGLNFENYSLIRSEFGLDFKLIPKSLSLLDKGN